MRTKVKPVQRARMICMELNSQFDLTSGFELLSPKASSQPATTKAKTRLSWDKPIKRRNHDRVPKGVVPSLESTRERISMAEAKDQKSTAGP